MQFEDRERVHRYQFRCDDRSLVQASFDRRVNRPLLRVLPRALNPNVCTLMGHLAQFSAFGLLLATPPGSLPSAVTSLAAAALLFIYCVADSVDGLHARAIGVSNPLGDFYDHGLDTLAGVMMPLGALSAYGASGEAQMAVVGSFALGWWSNNLARRRTATLVLPPFGAMEGNFLTIAVHLASALVGPALWRWRVGGVSLLEALVVVTVGGFTVVGVQAMVTAGTERRHAAGLLVDLALAAGLFVLTRSRLPPAALRLEALLVGLVATVHNWNVLQNVLLGVRYRSTDWVARLASGVALLGAWWGHGQELRALGLALGVVSGRLLFQVVQTSWFVRRELGVGLLLLSAKQRGKA